MLYIDALATNEESGVALSMVLPEGHTGEHVLKFMFKASDNEVKYEALLIGMELSYALGVEHVRPFSDTQLVISQAKG